MWWSTAEQSSSGDVKWALVAAADVSEMGRGTVDDFVDIEAREFTMYICYYVVVV